MRVVVAPDKFKGTATAAELVAALRVALQSPPRAASGAGAALGDHAALGDRAALVDHVALVERPMADGGEGTLEALGGANQVTTVSGPLLEPVEASWRLHRGTAVIEMARASGLQLVGGADGNDPLAATTLGTGELIKAAMDRGATRIIVGVGGSATTDGGLGALEAFPSVARLRGVEVTVACDVTTRFVDAAAIFGPQKGASPAQVRLLTNRLEALIATYRDRYGADIADRAGSGAAGGLGGGLAAVGAELVSGFSVIAEEVGLAEAIADADLVITGEGGLDDQSFEGKVVGGVIELAAEVQVPVVAIAGQITTSGPMPDGVTAVSLSERFGSERAMGDTASCFAEVAIEGIEAGAVGTDRRSF